MRISTDGQTVSVQNNRSDNIFNGANKDNVATTATAVQLQHTSISKGNIDGPCRWEKKWSELMQARQNNNRCRNCGGGDHWEYECRNKCGKCMAFHSPRSWAKFYRPLLGPQSFGMPVAGALSEL